jgi:hypothetical protein
VVVSDPAASAQELSALYATPRPELADHWTARAAIVGEELVVLCTVTRTHGGGGS